jgi:hypothetical protein
MRLGRKTSPLASQRRQGRTHSRIVGEARRQAGICHLSMVNRKTRPTSRILGNSSRGLRRKVGSRPSSEVAQHNAISRPQRAPCCGPATSPCARWSDNCEKASHEALKAFLGGGQHASEISVFCAARKSIMAMTKEPIHAARKAGKRVGSCAVAAYYCPPVGKLEVSFDSGVTLAVLAKLIQGLAGASTADLSKIEISPAG